MTQDTPAQIDPDVFVDQLYDIALDPSSLDTFIDAWNTAGLDGVEARQTLDEIENFDDAFRAHLKRAETFLNRGGEQGSALTEALAPFDSLAALILDGGQNIVACNEGAMSTFGIAEGASLTDMQFDPDARERFQVAVRDLLAAEQRDDRPDRLLKLEIGDASAPILFQMRKLTDPDGGNLVLVVTTQFHWLPALGHTLEEVFGLTAAEQGVVRSLVEGRDARTIAADRGTSEGTVRSQIKSILSKMNARSQSEVIRLVLSLRDVSLGAARDPVADRTAPNLTSADWLDAEVWKPFKTLTLPDGRRLDYHDMGPVTGAPVLYSHMGYCMARWSRSMLKLAFQHGLRIICPIRAGYGQSDNINPKADVLASTRDDTLALLAELGITRLPYLTQGNDLIFAVDLASKHPEVVTEIIGLCARPYLPGDRHYAGMGKWHRFFLSTAKHAPHLLKFTSKAAISMARRIGVIEMARQMNKGSPADTAILNDDEMQPIVIANAELVASKTANIAQAYTMEILKSESDWSDLMYGARETPTWFVNGLEDPAVDVATVAEYREAFPWISIEVVQNAGQLLIYQKYDELIPRIAAAAQSVVEG